MRIIVNDLVTKIDKESVSRADIFVDFTTNADFDTVQRKEWISRADEKINHGGNVKLTGWTIGAGGNISSRLYDKTSEIEKTGKDYLKENWIVNGWQEEEQAWRLEFQCKREFLKQMSVHTIADLVDIQNDIWRYCTNNWLRLARDNGTVKRSRWETTPIWKELQAIVLGNGSNTGIVRQVTKSRVPNDYNIFVNGFGYFLSYVAREGYVDINEAVEHYIKDAVRYFDAYTKDSKKYAGAGDYIDKKLNIKRKEYNKLGVENISMLSCEVSGCC